MIFNVNTTIIGLSATDCALQDYWNHDFPVQAIYPGSNFAHYGEPANHARPLGLAIFS
jgi:hypothetical protein